MKILRMDDDFVTEEITEWIQTQRMLLLPCIPHEHNTLGEIERDNRTFKEIIIKQLADKPHMSRKFWGMCIIDVLFKKDLMPCTFNPEVNAYYLWYGTWFDNLKNPLIPFGSIVYAHVPLTLQGTLSDKSIETYYVGFADGRHGGILLWNPKTLHAITRRSFKVSGPVKQQPSELTYEAAYEDNGEFVYNDDNNNSKIILPITNKDELISTNNNKVLLIKDIQSLTGKILRKKRLRNKIHDIQIDHNQNNNSNPYIIHTNNTDNITQPIMTSQQDDTTESIINTYCNNKDGKEFMRLRNQAIIDNIEEMRQDHPDWFPD